MSEAQRVTAALGGHWHGRYGTALCPAHQNTRTPALSLSDGAGGRLLAHCHAGCDFPSIVDALKGRGIIEGRGTFTPPDPAAQAQRESEARKEAEKKERQALACWAEGLPIHGSLAETYLRSRGITCELPESLRFHPSCWHPSAKRFPAMLARVDGAERFALHRTYLRANGRGKAEVEPAKAMLGHVAGGAVRLAEGAGAFVVAEGIETALSLSCGLLRGPATIWAALSTSGMAGLRLPPEPGKLIVATDGEDAGQAAGRKLASRAHALGWEVSTLPAPEGRDWNDVLCMKGAAA